MATSDNVGVVIMQNDLVELISTDEGEVLVNGIVGWCKGLELSFTPKQFVEHFECIGLTYVL